MDVKKAINAYSVINTETLNNKIEQLQTCKDHNNKKKINEIPRNAYFL